MRIIISLVVVAAVLGLLWFGGRPLYNYAGPSEQLLSQTGYHRGDADANAPDTHYRFAPMHPFWSDGAEKIRSIHIPPGEKIDTSDPDRWNFPEGTRIWKDFTRDNVLVETRMLYKTGSGAGDWDMAVYQWRDDYSDAEKLIFGNANALGTQHDIPSPSQCVSCHGAGETRRPLGITAVQLPPDHEDLLSLVQLQEKGLLTNPIGAMPAIPGDALTRKALGYLDTNCGTCHRDGSTFVPEDVPLRLNLTTNSLGSVEDTNAYKTAIGKEPLIKGLDTDIYISPGNPSESFLYKRLTLRDGSIWQMPPLATEEVDAEGAELIRAWIESLPPGESAGDE